MRLKIISNLFVVVVVVVVVHTPLMESPACIPITHNAIGTHTDGSTSGDMMMVVVVVVVVVVVGISTHLIPKSESEPVAHHPSLSPPQ